uniref:Uncharacterized protein n=1 Tax=viral metagenome TaxID=1070528 RepID=A0A6C0I1J6_9ZZZZ
MPIFINPPHQVESVESVESNKMQSPSYCLEPVYIEKDGQIKPYIPIEIKNGRDAYAASLHMLLNHFAQFHIAIVDIISDKYKIPVEEIMNTIKSDDRYINMSVCPNIHELSKAPSSSSSLVDVNVETVNVVDVVDSKKKVIQKIKINSDKKIKIKPKIKPINANSNSQITTIVNNL